MEILIACLLFAVGIVLVVKGGDAFVDSASWIAEAMDIPSFIIGATIVSLATTMPEMIVSVMAAAEGKVDMAVGNAVGSVIANTGLIMGVAMLAMSIPCSREKYLKQCLMLTAVAAILWIGCLGGTMGIGWSVVLVAICALFMWANIRSAKSEMMNAENHEPVDKKELSKNIIKFIIAAAAIVLGSRLMVDYGSAIASFLGVPERIIALTLVAIGTSLPELVTTITAIIKKESALSVGNIIGANIIDLSLILPLSSLAAGEPLPVSAQSVAVDLPTCLLITVLALLPLMLRQKASKVQGLALLIAYGIYLVIIL
jgi:cation:H+ antiporter